MQELKRIRNERGWSQRRLAKEAGVDQVTVNHVETGKRSPNVETLEKLALALDVEVGDFFPKVQAPLPLDFGVDAGPGKERLGMQSIARMRAGLLEQLADLWAVQLDRGQYDADTIIAMDRAGIYCALNHIQEQEDMKQFLEPDQLKQLERAEARLEEHDEKIQGVMLRMQGQVVEIRPYLAQRDAKREEVRRVISGTA